MAKKLFLFFLLVALALSTGVAFAQVEEDADSNADSAGLGQALKERAQNRWNARCDNLESRIQVRISRYENNKARHAETHNRIKEKISGFIDRLEAKGYDVSTLRADLQEFDTLIQQFASEYSSYDGELQASQNQACGESEGQFMNAWRGSKEKLRGVHQASLNIRLFYQQTIRPDILALKDQVKADLEPAEAPSAEVAE